MAMGMLVVPTAMVSQKPAMAGARYPRNTPANMVRKIHRVKYRSKKDNRLEMAGMVVSF